MTRPPNPKSAKVRKIKVWVADDIEKVINETLVGAVWKRKRAPYHVPATLLLPAKAKGKA